MEHFSESSLSFLGMGVQLLWGSKNAFHDAVHKLPWEAMTGRRQSPDSQAEDGFQETYIQHGSRKSVSDQLEHLSAPECSPAMRRIGSDLLS